jgi:hypothetical protein
VRYYSTKRVEEGGSLVDIDEVEKELKKATKAISAAAGWTGRYRVRMQVLCDNTAAPKKMPKSQQDNSIAQAGD